MEEEGVSILSMNIEEKLAAYNVYKQQELTEEEYEELRRDVIAEGSDAKTQEEEMVNKYETRKEMQKNYEKIRFGIKEKFDIYYIIDNEAHKIYYKVEEIEIIDKIINLKDFYTEMENRIAMLNKYIKDILDLQDIEVLQPR